MSYHSIILIVEDDEAIRFLLEDFLAQEGYWTIGAANGQTALEQIQQLKLTENRLPDLIISDFRMPVMDGIELAQHLHEDALLSQISFVLLTAAITLEKIITPTTAPLFTAFIAKPFDLDKLAGEVHRLLTKNKRVSWS